MFDKEFDEPIESEILQLVQQYEEAVRNEQQLFMEHSSFEYIIEYYEQRRNISRALTVVEAAKEQYPFSATFLVKKAEFLTEQKRYDEASELLEKAYVLDPNDINVHLGKTDILVWQGKHDEAIKLLNDLLLNSDEFERAEIYLEMADIYEDREKYFEVIDCLKETLRLAPNNEEALNRLWFSYELTELYDDSIQFHKQLIEDQPYSHIAWYNLAHAYNGLKQFDNAREAFDFVIAIDDTFDAAYMDCADMLIKNDHFKDAIEYLTCALGVVLKPKKELYYNLGVCYLNLENYRKSRYYLKKAVSVDQAYHEAYFKIGETYSLENNMDSALLSYQKAVDINDSEELYLLALANVYDSLEMYPKAAETFRKLMETEPGRKDNWLNLANALFLDGLYLDAVEILDDAQIIFTDDADINYIKSAYHHFLGNRKECILNLEMGLVKDFELYHMVFSMNDAMMSDQIVLEVIEQYRP